MTTSRKKIGGYDSDTEFQYTISLTPQFENKGGCSIENQGRAITHKTRSHTLNPNPPPIKEDVQWSYVVALTKSVYETRDTQQNINDYRMIAPTNGNNRLALLLGVNEQVTLSDGSDSDLEETERKKRRLRKEKNMQIQALDTQNTPVHVQFTYWQANWASRETNQLVSIDDVRSAYQTLKKKDPNRAKQLKRYEKSRSHYPFGKMRSLLFSTNEARSFLDDMARRVPKKPTILPPLFVLIQDSDYCNLNVTPIFYGSLQSAITLQTNSTYNLVKQELAVQPVQGKTLLDRYDLLISSHYATHRRYPRFIGGAHVYSMQEDINYLQTEKGWVGLDLMACKYWTRFGSEMGNAMKHLIGLVNSYSLYFHEPNTMMEWPGSTNPVHFGDKCEMEEYFRKQLSSVAKDAKPYAKFHAGVLVETSQKRKSSPFTIKFHGKFENGRFKNWSCEDIRSLQNMSQEIFTSNAWTAAVTTAFEKYKSKTVAKADVQIIKDKWGMCASKPKDARAIIARLYNLFDPHFIAYRYEESSKHPTLTWSAYTMQEQLAFLTNRQKSTKDRDTVDIKYTVSSLAYVLDRDHYIALTPDAESEANKELMREIKLLLTHIYNEQVCNMIIQLARETGELRRTMLAGVLEMTPALTLSSQPKAKR